jgi:hypothetical protein
MGVRAGEWQFMTVPQIEFLMRPNHDPTLRVWACGMLHSIGQRGRIAVTIEKGKRVPLTPGHIVVELNAFDPIGRMTRQSVRRELLELERQGAARQEGKKVKGGRRLYFYAKPLKSRTVAPEPEIVVWPDYKESTSCSKQDHLDNIIFSQVRKTLAKTFLRGLRSEIGTADEKIVVQPDYKKLVDETIDEVENVVRAAYNRLRIVVCSDPAYKEDSSSSVVKSMQAPVEAEPVVDACLPAPSSEPTPKPAEKPRLADVRGMFRKHISDEALEGLDRRIAAELEEPDYPRDEFIAFVLGALSKRRDGSYGTGLLLHDRGIWRDFCEQRKTMQAAAAVEGRSMAALMRIRDPEQQRKVAAEMLADPRGLTESDIGIIVNSYPDLVEKFPQYAHLVNGGGDAE